MNINLRYPSITAASEREQLAQVKSYLIQLVDDLNYALSTLNKVEAPKQTNTSEAQNGKRSYVLTEDDKKEIVQAVLDALAETPDEEE